MRVEKVLNPPQKPVARSSHAFAETGYRDCEPARNPSIRLLRKFADRVGRDHPFPTGRSSWQA